VADQLFILPKVVELYEENTVHQAINLSINHEIMTVQTTS
jgi:hypothetical protein